MIIERATEQRVQLYYDLYVPDDHAATARPLVIALHGYEGNKESMMALMRKVNDRDFIIASVQGPNAFFVRGADERQTKVGFGWMMQYKAEETIRLHHQTLLSVIETTAADHPVNRRAIFLVAFSQSVSLNYRFAFTHPDMIRGVVSVCGGIPGDWDADKYQPSDTDALIIAGQTDEFYAIERVRTFEAAIARRARTVTFKTYAVGHVFPRESLAFINEWITERATPRP
ncbi:MAG TPA: dienelactone hydrolase family protein [Blastocatellia bacterium]